MRSWASSAASAALLAVALAAPAAAAPVDDFARVTDAFRRELLAAAPDGRAAAAGRRDAAAQCRDVLEATPVDRRGPLFTSYFLDVMIARYEIERPLGERWLDSLEHLRLRSSRALLGARRSVRDALALLDAAAPLAADTCDIAREWAATGRMPDPVRRLQRLVDLSEDLNLDRAQPGVRALRRVGHRRAAATLERGLYQEDVEVLPAADAAACALEAPDYPAEGCG
jgi:hypothetical protein